MVVPSWAAVFISMVAPLFLKKDIKSSGRLKRTASHSTGAPYDLKIYLFVRKPVAHFLKRLTCLFH